MARRTKRKSRKSRRKRGGIKLTGRKREWLDKMAAEPDPAAMEARLKNMIKPDDAGVNTQMKKQIPLGDTEKQDKSRDLLADLAGGAKRKKGRKGTRKRRKGKSAKKKSRKKRKLNKFFALMLAAKKKKLPSFKYNGKTYKGKKHHRLGMVYKKA